MNPNNNDVIQIYPPLVKEIKFNGFRYSVFDYVPFKGCKISVQLTVDHIPFETNIYELNKNNGFDQWGNDDQFIIDWIKTNIFKS